MISDDQLTLWGDHLLRKISDKDPEHQTFKRFLEIIVERINAKNDTVICVSGERYIGKSSFSIVSALILKKLGLSFSMDNIFYGKHHTKNAISKIVNNERSIFIFDEMIDLAYSREAMSNLNKRITKILTKTRKLNHVYFFCIPRFKNLDASLRNDIVHFWIEVYWKSKPTVEHNKKNALASLFRKDRNPTSSDPWGVEEQTLKDKKKRQRAYYTPTHLEKLFRRIKSHICFFKFPPVPQVIEAEYSLISKEGLKITGRELVEETLEKKTPSATGYA